jgi:predicted pyridoxine 5'-phosphate oxidase superfamily flavin-nucleotide-binding protein
MPILTEEMKQLVSKQKLGFVATVCPDYTPNLSPKGTTCTWDDDHLVFLDLRSPQTIEKLLHNPSIEINLADQLIRRGFRFKGVASVWREGDLYDRILEMYSANGLAEYIEPVQHVVLVKVERAQRVTSSAYDLGETEETLAERYAGYWNDLCSRRRSASSERK